MRRMITGFIAVLALLFATSACTSAPKASSGDKTDDASRTQTYNQLVRKQPAHTGNYSPTRATKNFWIDTWMKSANKLSYVYLMNGEGSVFGYFVLDGLPVSYCVSLVPPTEVDTYDGGADGATNPILVPKPSVDGTYSSSSNCDEFYGKDATSGAYVEYSVGMGINALIFDQPMPQYGDAKPLGETKIK